MNLCRALCLLLLTMPLSVFAQKAPQTLRGVETKQLKKLLQRLEAGDFQAALHDIRTDRSTAYVITNQVNVLFYEWGASHPEAAMKSALTMGLRTYTASKSAIEGMANTTPEHALSALETLPLGKNHGDNIRTSFFRALARLDPAKALTFLDQLDESEHRTAKEGIVSGWINHSSEEALAWISEHERKEERQALLSMAMTIWAANDFPAALAHLKSLPTDDPDMPTIVS